MSYRIKSNRRQSFDSVYIEDTDLSSLQKAKSQTSILALLSNVESDSNVCGQSLTSPSKPGLNHRYVTKASAKAGQSGGGFMSVSNNQNLKATGQGSKLKVPSKSASSNNLLDSPSFNESSAIDEFDGPHTMENVFSKESIKDSSAKWDRSVIDIEQSKAMLTVLDGYIIVKKENISKYEADIEEITNNLIINFNSHQNDTNKKSRKEYGSNKKTAEKLMEKAKSDLEQLEYKRLIVSQYGIPLGKSPAEFVKSINMKNISKNDLGIGLNDNSRPFTKLKNSQKSISVENIHQSIKSSGIYKLSPLNNKTKNSKHNTEIGKKSSTLENAKVYFFPPDQTTKSSKKTDTSSSVGGDLAFQRKKSNSLCNVLDDDKQSFTSGVHLSPRHKSISAMGNEDFMNKNDATMFRIKGVNEEIDSMKEEIQEVKLEFQKLFLETEMIKLDSNTNAEINSQQMDNALERVDRLEQLLNDLRSQCQIEFMTWKDRILKVEDKNAYTNETMRMDFKDRIDACNNRVGLIDKKTEQLPFVSGRTGSTDMKSVKNQLYNLIISLVVFIMLLISTGANVLIKCINMGTKLSQNRVYRLLLLVPVVVGLAMLLMKLFSWTSATTTS